MRDRRERRSFFVGHAPCTDYVVGLYSRTLEYFVGTTGRNFRACESVRISSIHVRPQGVFLLGVDPQHRSKEDVLKFPPKLGKFRTALITKGFALNRQHALDKNFRTGGRRPVDLGAPPFSVKGNCIFRYMGNEPKLPINPVRPL